MHSPTENHMKAIYRILNYKREIKMYTDADWAKLAEDRRSTSGYCSFVWGNLVKWRSKKQNVVTRSSVEAELRSVALGICESLWLKMLLEELGMQIQGPISTYCEFVITMRPSLSLITLFIKVG